MGVNAYEVIAHGDDWDETGYNQLGDALGKVATVGLYPEQGPDYVLWRSGATYYARNGHTGAVTSNAACHTLANSLLATDTWLHFKGGSSDYDLTGAITFANYTDAVITGNPRRGTVFKPADTINAFEFDENWWCVLDGFKIDGSAQTTSGMGLKFTEATGTNYAKRNVVKNIDFSGCYQGIGDLAATTNAGANNIFEDLNFFDSTVRDIAISAANTGGWTFNRCHSDHIAVQGSGDYLFQFSGIHGLGLTGCSWLTGGAASKGTMLIEDTSFITMDRCDAEKAGQDIFVFEDCNIANISHIRAAESGMDAGGFDTNLTLTNCVDFQINNFFFGTSTGVSSYVVDIGGTSARCKLNNGNISSGSSNGLFLSDTASYNKFTNIDFFSNTGDDVSAGAPGATYNTFKNNTYQSGNGLSFAGPNNVYDHYVKAASVIDLSGGATDEDIFYAQLPCALVGFWLFYTEASSADVDWPAEAIRIGRTQDGVANDPDFFDEVVSEASKNVGYSKHHSSAGLAQQYIAAGDTVTVGTAGGKTGTGEIRVILQIVENAS